MAHNGVLRFEYIVQPSPDGHQELGHAAPDGAEMAEAGLGGIELFDQAGDALFERPDGELVGAAELQPFDLVVEGVDQFFEPGRYRTAAFQAHRFDRLRDGIDTPVRWS